MRSVFSRILCGLGVFISLAVVESTATATGIQITVTNDQPLTTVNNQLEGGYTLAPVWFGVQNGSFSAFAPGQTASAAITTLAELGNTAPLSALFAGNGPETTLTSGGAIPQFLPGQSATTTLNVTDPSVTQYLSYAGMVVPSNDFFMGNATPLQIFNASGNFLGTQTIQIYGSNVWDADTEVTDVNNGPAFVQGQNALLGTQITGGAVTEFLSETNSTALLNTFNGVETAGGYQLTNLFSANDLIATITITEAVPEPASLLLMGLGVVSLVVVRQFSRARQSGDVVS